MTRFEAPPSGALEEARRLAGPMAEVAAVVRLEGGQHAETWRVDLEKPARSVVVRQFPAGDPAAADEQAVLDALGGLGGLAPLPLAADLDGRWSAHPTSLVSWLDGGPDLAPDDPSGWARELARGLAAVHALPVERLGTLPGAFEGAGSRAVVAGPLAAAVRERWHEAVASPQVLTHGDYWSGNVVWRGGRLTGIVDWSGARRGPRGIDLSWCRLDLVLLSGEQLADEFLGAYEAATEQAVGEIRLWDRWAAAHSEPEVGAWAANYEPLGRLDLDEDELRRRHGQWTARLLDG